MSDVRGILFNSSVPPRTRFANGRNRYIVAVNALSCVFVWIKYTWVTVSPSVSKRNNQ